MKLKYCKVGQELWDKVERGEGDAFWEYVEHIENCEECEGVRE